MRGVYRLASGWYLRTVVQLLEDLRGQNVTEVAQLEAQGEILDLILRRLRRLEDQVTAGTASLQDHLQDQLNLLAEPLPNELTHRSVPLLNYERSHVGFRSRFGLWVNHAVNVEYSPEEVRWALTNERVVEVPFVFQSLSALAPPARIIDVGSCESLVALELASLGYRVTAIDIRPYAYSHPNLAAVTASILDWEGDDKPYDCAIVLSTIEHLGLPVYGQTRVEEDADLRAMERIRSLLRPGGLLIMTSPFGMSHVEPTQRVYSQQNLSRLLEGFRVNSCRVTRRLDGKTWTMDGQVSFDGLAELEKGNGTEQVVLLTAEKQ